MRSLWRIWVSAMATGRLVGMGKRVHLLTSLRTLPFLLLPVLLVVGVASPAAAATVPGEVADYIATELVDDLNDFYGPGTEGNGRLFTNTTTTSAGVRVFEFTPDFVAGVAADPPVRRLNSWVSVISIDKEPVGFAIVFIDPVSTSPQLESFTESADFGEVVLAMPETSSLVRDTGRSAWFSLDGEELTPIVSGTSGVATPTSVDDYRELLAQQRAALADEAPEPAGDYGGLILAGLILVLIFLLLAVEAFLPRWHRRLHGRHEVAPAVEPEAEPVDLVAAKPKPAPKSTPKPKPKPEAEPEPTAGVVEKAPAKPRTPRAKPPASS